MGIFYKISRVFWSSFALHAIALLCSSPGLQHLPSFSSGAALPFIARNETDQLALLQFKAHITNDPLGVFSSWNSSTHFCQWHGIKCGRRHRRVTALSLGSSKVAGSISPHIGNLSFLRLLDLRNNSLSQEIPPELGNLSRLKYLYLTNNSLRGEIPSNVSFCSNLVEFTVGWNLLVGKIPVEFGTLSKLEKINIRNNDLTESIPVTFGNLSSLQIFSASSNHISGMIPEALGQPRNLTIISLNDNWLSGTIPSSLFNLSSIRYFLMSGNQLEGTLPSNLGIALPYLQVFEVGENKFIGSIPLTISNLTNLEMLAIGRNRLTGPVPTLGQLSKLWALSLTSNHLGSGRTNDLNFLQSLFNATGLEVLAINDNNFGGIFPVIVGNFSWLRDLVLNSNKISGSIPNSIARLVKLERMELWNNRLSGGIPSEIGYLRELVILTLGGNKFSGNIPSSLGNLTNLNSLFLGNNDLRGGIPSSLGLCKNLLELELLQNNLSGTIPPELVSLSSLSIYLDLSYNHLSGSLPKEVEVLKNLGALDLSHNLLSGEIPTGLGSCVSLQFLSLQGNFLNGNFPSSLSSLKGIRNLDLSRNNFSGTIPQFLKTLQLEFLNLSFNDFEGEVPMQGVFKNASAVLVMGNKRLCGGVPKLQLPPCNLKSKKSGWTLKLKIIVSVVLGILGVIVLCSSLHFCCASKRSAKQPRLNNAEKFPFPLRISYQSLFKATDGFSLDNLIGNGSFGSVYRGTIDEAGNIAAIKVLNLPLHGSSKSFAVECEALRNIRHRNLVKILTACSSIDHQGNDFKALIYEFMVNGSLEEWLHPTPRTDEQNEITPIRSSLHLLQRLNIAIDVAFALEYLHNDCQPQVVHCDLKPSNILLDEEMVAHVGDFGIARILPEAAINLSRNQSSSIAVRGTIGYTAPEYGMGSEISIYGDVYSYGVLLLEMFTSKSPTDEMFRGSLNLHSFAKAALPMNVVEISDPMLLQDVQGETITYASRSQNSERGRRIRECLISIFSIGVACSAEHPAERMSIRNVATELNSIRKKLVEIGRNRA